MKKLFFGIICTLFVFCSFFVTSYAYDINLYIDDVPVTTDVKPVAFDGRTFLPVRSIFESLGANVEWVQATSQVVVSSEHSTIVLSPGSNIAYVDSIPFVLDAVPMVMNQRVLIPIRFVSEKLGYKVLWNQSDTSVRIYSDDANSKKNSVEKIEVCEERNSVIVSIYTTSPAKPTVSYASSPNRFIADYIGADLYIRDGKKVYGSALVNEVRYAIHDEYTRVVIESPTEVRYNVEYIDNITRVTVTGMDSLPGTEAKYKVAVDAGHGGNDTGSIGYDDNQNPVLYESHVNFEIACKVKDYLIAQGVDVVMTRTADVRLGASESEDLLERSRIANEACVDVFVSIHNNAFTSPAATGTEILYADTEDKIYNGLSSHQLALYVLNPLVKAAGLYNRGAKDSPMLSVLRNTTMPAILVEVAFITNPSDRAVLTDAKKIDEIGKAIAAGVMDALIHINK